MAKQNRFAKAPRQATINGRKILVSPRRGSTDLPASVVKDLIGDADKPEVCDRIWKAYQERGGSEERWMFRNVSTTLPNGITVHTRGERYLGSEPNPFGNVTEPHLRAALKAKGYL